MKRYLSLLLVLLLPAAAFAQSQSARETKWLQQLGLTDAQVSQVMDIQGKTAATVRADAVQLRLVRAEMDKALLPATVDMQAVNTLITQLSQTRADMQKALVGARVQLRQLMGDDNYRSYVAYLRQLRRAGMGPLRAMRGRMPGGAGGAGSGGPMMGGGQPLNN
jgi:hypothetical protein